MPLYSCSLHSAIGVISMYCMPGCSTLARGTWTWVQHAYSCFAFIAFLTVPCSTSVGHAWLKQLYTMHSNCTAIAQLLQLESLEDRRCIFLGPWHLMHSAAYRVFLCGGPICWEQEQLQKASMPLSWTQVWSSAMQIQSHSPLISTWRLTTGVWNFSRFQKASCLLRH